MLKLPNLNFSGLETLGHTVTMEPDTQAHRLVGTASSYRVFRPFVRFTPTYTKLRQIPETTSVVRTGGLTELRAKAVFLGRQQSEGTTYFTTLWIQRAATNRKGLPKRGKSFEKVLFYKTPSRRDTGNQADCNDCVKFSQQRENSGKSGGTRLLQEMTTVAKSSR